MAELTPNKMVTFSDLNYLVVNEGYVVKTPFTSSNECATKLEIDNSLHIIINAELSTYADNQLVPYRLLTPVATAWVGDSWVCVDDAPPVNNPPTAPTIVLVGTTESSISIDWSANPGTDDVGIVGYITYILRTGSIIPIPTTLDVGNVTNHTFNNLSDDEEYEVRVYAYDIEPLNSGPSNSLFVTTDTVGGTPTFTDPHSLIRECSANGIFEVSWQAATSNVGISHYNVYYRTGGGSWVSQNVGNNISATISGLINGTYEVYVNAVNNSSTVSGPTNTITLDTISSTGTVYNGDNANLLNGDVITLDSEVQGGDTLVWDTYEWDQYPGVTTQTLTTAFTQSTNITGQKCRGGGGLEFCEGFGFNVCVLDNPTPNPIALTWAWEPHNGTNDLWGEIRIQGDINTVFTKKVEVLSESGTWHLKDSNDTSIQYLYDTDVSSLPHTWTPNASTLSQNAGNGYYYTYDVAAYRQSAGTTQCRITMLSATNYNQFELPSPIIFTF